MNKIRDAAKAVNSEALIFTFIDGLNKACVHDGITYEHIRYGGNLLVKHLCHLFNIVMENALIPNDRQKSTFILLYKGDNKPKTDTNAYRGIFLVPSITEVFEKLIEIKLTEIRTDFPNPQQVAYQKPLCSMNVSFNLLEVVYYHVERNGTVYVVLLDSAKAFDTVPHDARRMKFMSME